jgi:FMN phosphatase YigB (HAD superfamily)
MFAEAGVDPAVAIVVDDCPDALSWARRTGARSAWVQSDRGEARDADFVVGGLRDLPAALAAVTGRSTAGEAAGGGEA